ncbi:hypothetical protein E5288_WYG021981 [Bos mutus]|uniref:Homeobox domain-containing protein n=1 Tax=Bos mutus TaxID=72004 RepID=A0A6B0S698_9CETA|nr:hypothetical protein [Bos mutus]
MALLMVELCSGVEGCGASIPISSVGLLLDIYSELDDELDISDNFSSSSSSPLKELTFSPIATGSQRRRLFLKLSQKDALQALFQQNLYPGIVTRERLA